MCIHGTQGHVPEQLKPSLRMLHHSVPATTGRLTAQQSNLLPGTAEPERKPTPVTQGAAAEGAFGHHNKQLSRFQISAGEVLSKKGSSGGCRSPYVVPDISNLGLKLEQSTENEKGSSALHEASTGLGDASLSTERNLLLTEAVR